MATARQIEANRRNAQKSTGPRTEEGKAASRANAVTHGLSGAGVVPPPGPAQAAAERAAEWHSSLRPYDAYQTWLLEMAAAESIRAERCRGREEALRAEATLRAQEAWEEDRRREAEEVAARIGRDPALTVARLQATLAGCRILRGWWGALLRAFEEEPLTAAQEDFAMDLLGTPRALRTGGAGPMNGPWGGDYRSHQRRVIEGEVARLDALIAGPMPAREERARAAAAAGVPLEESREIKLVRRYEAASMRRLRWAREQIRRPRQGLAPSVRDLEPPPDPPEGRADETKPISPEPGRGPVSYVGITAALRDEPMPPRRARKRRRA